jgi:Zn-dependent protease with chaperone function
MDPTAYDRLVSELESLAQTSPASLKRRVRLLIALGYAYVLLVLALLVVAVCLVIWALATLHALGLAKFTLPLLWVVGVVAKSLRVRIAPPEGCALTKGAAPTLDARVAEIQSRLSAPAADRIILNNAFNASVMQVPRWGIFGFSRTYLVLGVPIMLCLTREQFDAVLAHEFAHLSSSHPKLGLWVHRMSRTWSQLLQQLEQRRSWGHHLFERFIRWYQPRLQAYGLVMSRRDEFEADADAASVTSAEAMCAALVGMEVGERALHEHFWRPLWQTARETPAPPRDVWPTIGAVWRTPVAPELRAAWLGTALARRTDGDDTHPSFRERLGALGFVESDTSRIDALPTLAVVGGPSAAEHYLGNLTSEMLSDFDSQWRSSVDESWRERHKELQALHEELVHLEEREQNGPLTPQELWRKANAYEKLGDWDNAIRACEALLALDPDHVRGHYLLGALQLMTHDDAGIEHLKRSMRLSSEFHISGAAKLRDYYASRGMEDEKAAMAHVLWHCNEELRLAMDERHDVKKRDELLPVLLTPEYSEILRSCAANDERIARMWVAKKATTHLPDYPMIVILVEPVWWRGKWRGATGGLAQDVLTCADVGGWVHLYVVPLGAKTEWMAKRMKRIQGSLIFDRE